MNWIEKVGPARRGVGAAHIGLHRGNTLTSNRSRSHDLQSSAASIDRVGHGPVLNRASMVIDAAINGQGVALARTTLAAWDLINGRLVRPFPESQRLSKTYWIVCPKATAGLPKIVTFRDWLLAQASKDLRQLKTLGSPSKPSRQIGDRGAASGSARR
jgi:LysR family transcriptional regulator, glycine cleavage system transcriptional activator